MTPESSFDVLLLTYDKSLSKLATETIWSQSLSQIPLLRPVPPSFFFSLVISLWFSMTVTLYTESELATLRTWVERNHDLTKQSIKFQSGSNSRGKETFMVFTDPNDEDGQTSVTGEEKINFDSDELAWWEHDHWVEKRKYCDLLPRQLVDSVIWEARFGSSKLTAVAPTRSWRGAKSISPAARGSNWGGEGEGEGGD